MELYRRGKVKDVYIDGDRMLFVFTDKISVFDLVIPNEITGKGRSLCLTAHFWFKKLHTMGIGNHFLDLKSPSEMYVRRFTIKPRLSRGETGCLVPLEFITRHYLAGSLYRRLKDGKVTKEDLGLDSDDYGIPLDDPYFEITTKFEKYDRGVSDHEAMEISGLDASTLDEIKELCIKIDEMMADEVGSRNLIHVDGKKEFAIDHNGNVIVVDTFGTCDEDRWWDKAEYEKGRIIELSKEFVRQYYIQSGFYETLKEKRDKGEDVSEIPPLPHDIIRKAETLYRDMYERITGEGW